jgi:hypothetical protein
VFSTIVSKKKKNPISVASVILFAIGISCILPINIVAIANYKNVDGTIEKKIEGNVKYYTIECNTNSRFDFGYLQGKALSKEIINLHIILSPAIGFIRKENRDLVVEYEKFVDKEYLDEMRGIAQGASFASGIYITYRDVLLQNIFTDLVYARQIPLDFMACSAFAYINDDGSVSAGQNFDFTKIMGYKQLFDTTAFVHTKFNGMENFGLRMGGMLAIATGRNEHFSLYTNVVKINEVHDEISEPTAVRIRKAFEYATNVEEFEHYMNFSSMPASYNFIFANASYIKGFQVAPQMYRMNTSRMIVNTNTYTNEDMNSLLFDSEYSFPRQRKVESLLSEKVSDGTLSEVEMLEILNFVSDTNSDENIYREEGGAMDTITICYMTNSYFGFLNSDHSKANVPIA